MSKAEIERQAAISEARRKIGASILTDGTLTSKRWELSSKTEKTIKDELEGKDDDFKKGVMTLLHGGLVEARGGKPIEEIATSDDFNINLLPAEVFPETKIVIKGSGIVTREAEKKSKDTSPAAPATSTGKPSMAGQPGAKPDTQLVP